MTLKHFVREFCTCFSSLSIAISTHWFVKTHHIHQPHAQIPGEVGALLLFSHVCILSSPKFNNHSGTFSTLLRPACVHIPSISLSARDLFPQSSQPPVYRRRTNIRDYIYSPDVYASVHRLGGLVPCPLPPILIPNIRHKPIVHKYWSGCISPLC